MGYSRVSCKKVGECTQKVERESLGQMARKICGRSFDNPGPERPSSGWMLGRV
jgi:hypothetical protein